MPAGLQVWDAAGNLIFDTADRAGRVLGSVTTTTGAAGSITNAALSQGTPFALVEPLDTLAAGDYVPVATFGGTTMSWTAGYACLILYGVY